MHILPDAGHQMFQDNPQGFIDLLINDLKDQVRYTW
jgi:hypothetical protein